jgi:hypothetical protein
MIATVLLRLINVHVVRMKSTEAVCFLKTSATSSDADQYTCVVVAARASTRGKDRFLRR